MLRLGVTCVAAMRLQLRDAPVAVSSMLQLSSVTDPKQPTMDQYEKFEVKYEERKAFGRSHAKANDFETVFKKACKDQNKTVSKKLYSEDWRTWLKSIQADYDIRTAVVEEIKKPKTDKVTGIKLVEGDWDWHDADVRLLLLREDWNGTGEFAWLQLNDPVELVKDLWTKIITEQKNNCYEENFMEDSIAEAVVNCMEKKLKYSLSPYMSHAQAKKEAKDTRKKAYPVINYKNLFPDKRVTAQLKPVEKKANKIAEQ